MIPNQQIELDKFHQALIEIGAEQGYVLDVAPDGDISFYLKLKADGNAIEAEDGLIVQAIIDRSLKSQQPLIIRNALTDSRFANEWDVMRLQVRSVMCVPLWKQEQIKRLVYVENRSERGAFDEDQVVLLERLGEPQAVETKLVVEQAPLLEEVENKAPTPLAEDMPKSPNPRYILHESIGQGGMGVVHRATDRLTGEIVALKQVHLSKRKLAVLSQMGTTTQRNLHIALAQEFQIVAGMRHPNIISVLDYGFGPNRQPYFTMTYLPDAQPFLEAAEGLDETGKLKLVRQLLQALAYLHRRGIIHRDLKPSNILVSDQSVQVLDFGLSVSQNTGLTSAGGTLFYMAPELLDTEAASFASDLYAVGVIAYQLFIGRHPFDVTSPEFAKRVREFEPDLVPFGVSNPLSEIVGKLLAKQPADRYSNAEACLTDVRAVLGETNPVENVAIRESYLQAATFVGRRTERAQLEAVLSEVQTGNGQCLLIGGESGVGKSRLVEELRAHALVSGWIVMMGHTVDEGRVSYQIWRDVAPRLILNSPPNDLEASILRQIVPNIEQLLDRDVAELPYLDSSADQDRLILTLVSLIQRQTQPTLLLLEDLQWAREGLTVVKQLLKVIEQTSNVMVVGTYRSDERPSLPDELPEAQTMMLERLNASQIQKLSEAILGEVVSTPDIVSLLIQETEGNTFFMVEVLRTLAEEAGDLDEIGTMALPSVVFTSGMERLLLRRIERISESDQALLNLAAVAGRQLDLRLLSVVAKHTDVAAWLQRTLETSVLVVRENQWFFAHDKLRETILAALSPQHRRLLHQQVAEALETVYANQAHYNQPILEHWYQAGNIDKELYYLPLVAQHLIDIRADYGEAFQLIERGENHVLQADPRRVSLLNLQAEASRYQGNYRQAKDIAQIALKLAQTMDDKAEMAKSFATLGYTATYLDNYDQAITYYQRSLAVYQILEDRRGVADVLFHQGVVASYKGDHQQAETCYYQSLSLYQDIADQRGEANCLHRLGSTLRGQNTKQAINFYQQSLVLYQAIGDQRGIANALANLGNAAWFLGHYEQATDYLQQSLTMRRNFGDQYGISMSLNNMGRVAYLQGQYEQALDYGQQSYVIRKEIGNLYGLTFSLLIIGFSQLKLHYDQVKSTLWQALSTAHSIQSHTLMESALAGFAWLYLRQGQPTQATELISLIEWDDALLWLDGLEPQLTKILGVAAFQDSLKRGKAIDIDIVAKNVLNEFSEQAHKKTTEDRPL
ncbi:MAG: tetratricopeptide repeat protein [Chloroflexota bacterium]